MALATLAVLASETASAQFGSASIDVSGSSVLVSEGGATGTFTVKLGSRPLGSVTVPISTSDSTEASVTPSELTFTTSNYNTPQTVTVHGVDELVDDGTAAFTVYVGPSESTFRSYDGLYGSDVTGQNEDNDLPNLTVTIAGVAAEPSAGTSFTVTRDSVDAALGQPLKVHFTYAGTATSGADYTALPENITLAAGSTSNAVSVAVIDDLIAEPGGNETIQVTLASDAAYKSPAPSAVQIKDNEANTAYLTASSTDVEEGHSTRIQVVLANVSAAPVEAHLVLSGPGASDVAMQLNVTVEAGDHMVNVTVDAIDDDEYEGDEILNVTLKLANNATISATDATVILTIHDDDPAPEATIETDADYVDEGGDAVPLRVVLERASPVDSVIEFDFTGIDADRIVLDPPGPFVIPAGELLVETTLAIQADAVDQLDAALRIGITPANGFATGLPGALFVNDDDATPTATLVFDTSAIDEDTGTAHLVATLERASDVDLTFAVRYARTHVDPVFVGPATITVPAGQLEKTLTVTIVNDDVDQDDSTITATLQSVVPAGRALFGATGSDLVIANDDIAGFLLLSADSLTVSEAGSTATVSMRLTSQPLYDVEVPVAAAMTGEAVVSPPVLRFTPTDWYLPHDLTVTGLDDLVDDGDSTFAILTGAVLSNDALYASFGAADTPDVRAHTTDDDVRGIVVAPTGTVIGEDSRHVAPSVFTIRLATQPTSIVTIRLSTSDGSEAILSTPALTFTLQDWMTPHEVKVFGVDDALTDGDAQVFVLIAPAVGADYEGIDPQDLMFTNKDDEAPHQAPPVVRPDGSDGFSQSYNPDAFVPGSSITTVGSVNWGGVSGVSGTTPTQVGGGNQQPTTPVTPSKPVEPSKPSTPTKVPTGPSTPSTPTKVPTGTTGTTGTDDSGTTPAGDKADEKQEAIRWMLWGGLAAGAILAVIGAVFLVRGLRRQ